MKRPINGNDRWGGCYENRMRFPVEVVRRVREAVGEEFIVIFRIAAMDMLQGGMSWDEVVQLGKAIEKAGANIIDPLRLARSAGSHDCDDGAAARVYWRD